VFAASLGFSQESKLRNLSCVSCDSWIVCPGSKSTIHEIPRNTRKHSRDAENAGQAELGNLKDF